MQAHEKHFVGVVEDILSAISMMNVPVKDKHALTLVNSILSHYCHIVEEAEALDEVTVRMMSGWARYAVATLIYAIYNLFYRS